MTGAALAHESFDAPGQLTLASAWTLDPLVLVPLALAAFLYRSLPEDRRTGLT